MIDITTAHATSSAAPAAFFARWIDHSTWHQWSPDMEWVKYDGKNGDPAVVLGGGGSLKPIGAPVTKFVIGELEQDRLYTDVSMFPGAKLYFRHTAAPVGNGSVLTVHIWLAGPLAFVWNKILGAGFRASAQADLDRLVSYVEQGAPVQSGPVEPAPVEAARVDPARAE